MKKNIIIFFCFCVLICFMFIGCGTVSPKLYAKANVRPYDIPPGRSIVTYETLAGEWRDESGDTYIFQRNNFRSSALNKGTPGSFEINPVLSSYMIVFYKNRNVEYSSNFGGQFFFEHNYERDHLGSFFVILSEDRRTLKLGDKTFYKVGA